MSIVSAPQGALSAFVPRMRDLRDRLVVQTGDLRDRLPELQQKARASGDWITPAGWVAISCVALGAMTWRYGWTEVRVLGLIALTCLMAALAWIRGRTSYEVDFELLKRRVTIGEVGSGRLLIRNKAKRALFPTRIELTVGRGRAHFTLPSLGHDDEHEELFEIPTHRRAVITIGPVSSVRSDPLKLLRRTQRWAESADLYVHPTTVPLAHDTAGFIRDVEGVTTQDLSSNDVSFHALREYHPGDDRRAIHWRTTARTGRLMVRQFEETRRAHLLVVLPTHPDDYGSDADFESAISIAASLARHAFVEGREASIYTSDGLLRFTSGPVMLDRLTEVLPATTRIPIRDLTARAIHGVPGASVVALVAGSEIGVTDLRSAHRALPLGISSCALRCITGAQLAQRRVGDLTIVDLPDVHALPAAMRSLR